MEKAALRLEDEVRDPVVGGDGESCVGEKSQKTPLH